MLLLTLLLIKKRPPGDGGSEALLQMGQRLEQLDRLARRWMK